VHEGRFVDDYLESKGKRILEDGTVFEGQFSHDEMNKVTSIIYPDGSKYEGDVCFFKK
jgi:hypothetical protein